MRRLLAPLAVSVVLVFIAACGGGESDGPPTPGPTVDPSITPEAMTLTSEAFEAGGTIPEQYTCYGRNASPPLSWSDPPEGTKALVVFVDDPMGPVGNLNMWNLFNLPPDLRELEEGQPAGVTLKGGEQGLNSVSGNAYYGPCPLAGAPKKEIVFRVIALNAKVRPIASTASVFVGAAMEDHILATGELRAFTEKAAEEPTPAPTAEATPAPAP